MFTKVDVWYSSAQPRVTLERNSSPVGGDNFPHSVGVSGHDVSTCFEYRDGDQVGDPFLVQPDLEVPVGDPLFLVFVVLALHLPVIVASPSLIFFRNSLMKNVWYDAQLSK